MLNKLEEKTDKNKRKSENFNNHELESIKSTKMDIVKLEHVI